MIVSLPLLGANLQTQSDTLNWMDYLGLFVFIIGFAFEAGGDFQLARFKKNPNNKGKVLKTGFWKYTRHPNYFGEVTQWWGLWLIAINAPNSWLSIVGPLTITILILKVSGIPMLEKKMAENPNFIEYKKRTSAFIPLPPKNKT